MAERERVRKAIEGPVAEATKLLREAGRADTETRLMMLLDGWGRGLAAGLEELALAMEDLRRARAPEPIRHGTPPESRGEGDEVSESLRAAAEPNAEDDDDDDEERLRKRAADSRAATAELRERASSELDADQPSP